MTRRQLWITFVALIAVGVLATALVQHFRTPGYTKDVRHSEQLDTAHVARHDSSTKIDTAVHVLERSGKKTLRAVDSIGVVADTIRQAAVSMRDSLDMWRARDSLHRAEIDSLHRVIRSDSLQKLLLTVDRDAWKYHSDSVVTAMDRLRTDLEGAEKNRCRILPFVPCPSRKETLVAGLVIGALVASHPHETKQLLTLGHSP